jgi:transposase
LASEGDRALPLVEAPENVGVIEWSAWCAKAARSGLEPMKRAAKTVRTHLWAIANAIELGVINAKSESFNAAVQKISNRAHGFRSHERFAAEIYFHLGGLDLYPTGVCRR